MMGCSPGGAVWESNFRADVSHIDDGSSGGVFGGIDNKLEGNFHLVSNVFAADLVLTQAECAALFGGGWALSPAYGANTVGAVLAGRVAKSSAHYLVLMALQRGARGTTVGALSAGNTDIGHTRGAVRGADTAADIMEVIVALGVPKGAPLFAAFALVHLSSASTIGVGLVAVSAIVTEFAVSGAVLPADGADSLEAILAVVEAKGAILLFIISAGRERLSSCAAVSFLPA